MIRSQKNLVFAMLLTVFYCFSHLYALEQIVPLAVRIVALFLICNHEQFAPVALYKLATGAICSWERVNHYFALSLTKNERIAPKTKERIPNPGSDLLFS